MKNYFVGLTLAPNSTIESGIAVVDKNNEIIYMDKLFTMNDVRHFFENFSSLKDSSICVSLPQDNTMLNGKWRLMSKLYQPVNLNKRIIDKDHQMQRYSNRGCDFLSSLVDKGISVSRYELFLTRQALGLTSNMKDRSPSDCKFLQSCLRLHYDFPTLPTNMMPMAQIEALVGVILAKKLEKDSLRPVFKFNGIDVYRG